MIISVNSTLNEDRKYQEAVSLLSVGWGDDELSFLQLEFEVPVPADTIVKRAVN